jgi:DNA-binding response OmpR family regulator
MAPFSADILIIDDDAATVRLLVESMRGRGFKLRVALDGRDGHSKARQNPPDAILLDVSMPMLDGHQLCRLLKDDPRTADVPVIFLSGHDAPADKLDGFGVGGSDYITKPYQIDELVARLQVHVHIRRRLRGAAPELPPPAAPELASRDELLLQKTMEILRADLAAPPGLVDLARQVGSNTRSLTELFRRHVGLPVFGWLREERHKRACDLLLSADHQIGEIAASVGYANAAAFATAFRERYGFTPSAFRRSAGLGGDGESS